MIKKKKCSKCKEPKTLDEFHNDRSKADGKTTQCAECINKRANGYHRDEKEAAKAYNVAAIRYHGEFASLNQMEI